MNHLDSFSGDSHEGLYHPEKKKKIVKFIYKAKQKINDLAE